jgi:hypothetical protein
MFKDKLKYFKFLSKQKSADEPIAPAAPVVPALPSIAPGRTIIIEYLLPTKSRYNRTPHQKLFNIINKNRHIYRKHLTGILKYKNNLTQISKIQEGNDKPFWNSITFPGLDSISNYYLISKYKPKNYFEVGSGVSTKFSRQAIIDHALNTKITSIDPHPWTDIDAICDRTIRKPLEDVDLSIFNELQQGDILFIDGSHRCFMNSDVTAVFLDILPNLKKGVIVGFHDIFLPFDYCEDWVERYYSEQYLLASYLLADGNKFEIILPNYFIYRDTKLNGILDPLWADPKLTAVERQGGSFWMIKK